MEILYQDKQIVVCVKPVGLTSEEGDNGLPGELRRLLGGEIYPVHRLDQNVGGIMVYARGKEAAASMSRMVQENRLVKEYLAVVASVPHPQEGILEDYLWKDSGKNKVFVVKRPRKGVKLAKLSYRVLQSGDRSLVQVRLFTGRSHQIRVQFASRGWPLVGDHKYGSRDLEKAPALFSFRLTFPHPKSGEELTFMRLPENEPWSTFPQIDPAEL